MPLLENLRMTKKNKRHVEELSLGKRRNMRISLLRRIDVQELYGAGSLAIRINQQSFEKG
jgi:hypothetical protein